MKEPCFTYFYDGEWKDWRELEGQEVCLPNATKIEIVKVGLHKRLREVCVRFKIACTCGCGATHQDSMTLVQFTHLLHPVASNPN
jgi:hypothetical protein